MATEMKQRQAAKEFVKDWLNKGYEKGETQRFWIDLLHRVFGIDNPTQIIQFEIPVKTITKEKGSDFIDAYIATTKVLIEQKGSHVDLSSKAKQSDGTYLTPYQQGRRYAAGLPQSLYPRWIVACNFTTFEVHDMERPNDAPEVIELKDLEKEYHRLSFLIDNSNVHLKKELEVSIQAGEIVGVLYDKILEQYKDPENPESQKALNKLCVRLVFCLYAEDAGIFGSKNMFHDYMEQFPAALFREQLIKLFKILDQKPDERDPYEDESLLAFPYVNGGMFAGEIEIPRITDEIRTLILRRASDDFDWSLISPTIFGAVFESTLNPETRRAGGMHYTSIENIHKVIDPLFLDDLKAELADIKMEKVAKNKKSRAIAFQDKISKLKFLDPACGSGNFLTESYTSLRRLENVALQIIYDGNRVLGDFDNPIKVSINQFYGIEINDFACSVAQTALWIAESQMMQETDDIVGITLDPLPLKTYNNILEGNALRMDWRFWPVMEDIPTIIAGKTFLYPYPEVKTPKLHEPIVRYDNIDLYTEEIELRRGQRKPRFCKVDFDYIMGNPPFLGGMIQSKEQKQDMTFVFGKKVKGLGELDYVAAWYRKTADIMKESPLVSAAFVSTNSICQGEQVSILWEQLMKEDVVINFAYQTFRWDSESNSKAHVHVVIIGFSRKESNPKRLYSSAGVNFVTHINGYLTDAPDVFIHNISSPICNVPPMAFGNMPRDGGGFILSEEEKDVLEKQEPISSQWIHPYMGADEFIKGKRRYCLWLQDANPSDLRKCPTVMDRIESVRTMRLASSAESTKRMAEIPTLFAQITQDVGRPFIIIPSVSSEKRRYVPIGFMSPEVIASNLVFVISDANIYHFGVLTSLVHNAWMREVAGRLESRYRYSKDIVYNNFPWPQPTESQKEKISQTAQAILDARALYPESSLADLYDELAMPIELRKAHRANDAAVLEVYGFPKDATEPEIVARLFKMYQELTK